MASVAVEEQPPPVPSSSETGASNSTYIPWAMDKIFLLVSFIDQELQDVQAVDPETVKFDWDKVCKKINTFPDDYQNFSSSDCQSQYTKLVKRVGQEFKTDDRMTPLLTLRDKHQFILRTIGLSRVYSSQNRREELKKSIEDMVKKIRNLETDEAVALSDVSDGEGSDSDIEFIGYVEPVNKESFAETFMKMFGVDYRVLLNFPPEATVDEIINATSNPDDVNLLSLGADPHTTYCKTSTLEFTPLGSSSTSSTNAASSQLINLVRTKIAGATEEDKSKNAALHSPTHAPTLSKLLEMPPRDRGQPLPSVQSLMTSNNDAQQSGAKDEVKTPLSQQDSPTKLLAALGTSTTPVNIVMSSSQALPAGIMNMPISQLKTLEDIEIANDYVMESGLVQEIMEAYDAPSLQAPSLSSQQLLTVQDVSVTDDDDDLPALLSSGDPEDTLQQLRASPDRNVKRDIVIQDVHTSALPVQGSSASATVSPAKDNVAPVIVNNYLQQDAVIGDKDGKQAETVAERTVEAKVPVKKDSDLHRGRGKKNEKVEAAEEHSVPLTRNAIKAKSDVSEDSKSTISRRSQTRAVADEKKPEKIADVKGSPKKGAKVSTDVHTPNLRSSRRGPTPTPGKIAAEEKVPIKSTEDDGSLSEADSAKTEIVTKEGSPKKDGGEKAVDEEPESKPMEIEINAEDSSKKKRPITPSYHKERSESGDVADDDNSNSGDAKKRLTRRSAKIVMPKSEIKSRDNSADAAIKEENPPPTNETKTRQSKSMSRLKHLHEEAHQVCGGPIDLKEENANGKRVTRARAQTSTSPRIRTKSTGSTKSSQANTTETEMTPTTGEAAADPGPSRATRSRAAASTPTNTAIEAFTPASLPPLESNPSSPSSTTNTSTLDEDKDQKMFRKSLMVLWNRIAIHKFANVFRKPISDDSVTGYSRKVRRPMDLMTIKKNIETGAIKSVSGLEKELYLMFFNSIMFNPTSSTNSQLSVFDMTTEIEHDVLAMIEDFKNAQKMKTPSDNDKKDDIDPELEAIEEKIKQQTTPVKPGGGGRKRRNLSISIANSDDVKETKRRTLRTSTTASTTATTAWQSTRKKLPASPDIANPIHRSDRSND